MELIRDFPNYRSGRFLQAEDAVILKRLQVVTRELNMSTENCEEMMAEINRMPGKKKAGKCGCILILPRVKVPRRAVQGQSK